MLLNVTNLLTHLNHFAFVPIIFAILFVLGLKHMICKVCTTFIILNDNKYVKSNVGYKKMEKQFMLIVSYQMHHQETTHIFSKPANFLDILPFLPAVLMLF